MTNYDYKEQKVGVYVYLLSELVHPNGTSTFREAVSRNYLVASVMLPLVKNSGAPFGNSL